MRTTTPMVALLAALSGCGWTVQGAREAYAEKWCDYNVRCQQIGSGKSYASTDECLTAQRAAAQNLWPTSACDGKIYASGLDVCLKAIEATECNNLLDQGLTYLKCSQGNVCQ